MCLLVTRNAKIQILKEDLIVYKRVYRKDEKYFSAYRDFEYKLGAKYPSVDIIIIRNSEVAEGYHAYLRKEDCIRSMWLSPSFITVPFIIPKGSKVIYGTFFGDDSIAASDIRMLEPKKKSEKQLKSK